MPSTGGTTGHPWGLPAWSSLPSTIQLRRAGGALAVRVLHLNFSAKPCFPLPATGLGPYSHSPNEDLARRSASLSWQSRCSCRSSPAHQWTVLATPYLAIPPIATATTSRPPSGVATWLHHAVHPDQDFPFSILSSVTLDKLFHLSEHQSPLASNGTLSYVK